MPAGHVALCGYVDPRCSLGSESLSDLPGAPGQPGREWDRVSVLSCQAWVADLGFARPSPRRALSQSLSPCWPHGGIKCHCTHDPALGPWWLCHTVRAPTCPGALSHLLPLVPGLLGHPESIPCRLPVSVGLFSRANLAGVIRQRGWAPWRGSCPASWHCSRGLCGGQRLRALGTLSPAPP